MKTFVFIGSKNNRFSFGRKDGSPLNISELPRANYALAFKLSDGTTTHHPMVLVDNTVLVCETVIPDYATHVQVVLSWNDGNNVLMGPVVAVRSRFLM